jgi:hypothetical protein
MRLLAIKGPFFARRGRPFVGGEALTLRVQGEFLLTRGHCSVKGS